MEAEHRRQVMPTTTDPHVNDIATPDWAAGEQIHAPEDSDYPVVLPWRPLGMKTGLPGRQSLKDSQTRFGKKLYLAKGYTVGHLATCSIIFTI